MNELEMRRREMMRLWPRERGRRRRVSYPNGREKWIGPEWGWWQKGLIGRGEWTPILRISSSEKRKRANRHFAEGDSYYRRRRIWFKGRRNRQNFVTFGKREDISRMERAKDSIGSVRKCDEITLLFLEDQTQRRSIQSQQQKNQWNMRRHGDFRIETRQNCEKALNWGRKEIKCLMSDRRGH